MQLASGVDVVQTMFKKDLIFLSQGCEVEELHTQQNIYQCIT